MSSSCKLNHIGCHILRLAGNEIYPMIMKIPILKPPAKSKINVSAPYSPRDSDVGSSENRLYNGIIEALDILSSIQEIKLGICTSKRVDFAERILEHFSLRHHFSFVNGGDIGIEKWQQLGSLLEQGDINQKTVMIGDRYIDITAAQKNNLGSAGVLWGYGSHSELSQYEPSHIFTSPCELVR